MKHSTPTSRGHHSLVGHKYQASQFTSKVLWLAFCFHAVSVLLFSQSFVGVNRCFSQQVVLPERVAQSDGPTYKAVLDRVHRSLTSQPLEASKANELANLPASKRQAGFDSFLDEAFRSQAFAQAQAQAWMRDHFELDVQDPKSRRRIEVSGWDTEAFRKWLTQAFHFNERFDLFVQNQLTPERESSSKIPTHAWYLAGQRSDYQIVANPTPIESNLIRQFKTALESIEKAENIDWKRLQSDIQKDNSQVRRWWLQQNRWPQVPAEELVVSWPASDLEKPPAIRAFREWTLVLTGRFSKSVLENQESVVLFVQSHDGTIAQPAQRSLIIELRHGRPVVRMIHDDRISILESLCQEPLVADTPTQIAFVNDGLGRPNSIRVLIDGQPQVLGNRQVQTQCYKEMLCPDASRWHLGDTTGDKLGIEQFDFYRLALSGPECRGLADLPWSDSWDDLDDAIKLQWAEHYAQRVDVQWRYQRESRGHYVANLAAILESESMLPVLGRSDQAIFLVYPNRFPNSLLGDKNIGSRQDGQVVKTHPDAWSLTGGLELLAPCAMEYLARAEVIRSWKSMTRWSEKENRSEWQSDRLASEFAKDWDRRKMLCKLLEEILSEVP